MSHSGFRTVYVAGWVAIVLVGGCGASQAPPSAAEPEIAEPEIAEAFDALMRNSMSTEDLARYASDDEYEEFLLDYFDLVEKVYGVLSTATDEESAEAAAARLDELRPALREIIRRGEAHGTWQKATWASGFSPLKFNPETDLMPGRDVLFREVEINNVLAMMVLKWSTKLKLMEQMESVADDFFRLESPQ